MERIHETTVGANVAATVGATQPANNNEYSFFSQLAKQEIRLDVRRIDKTNERPMSGFSKKLE